MCPSGVLLHEAPQRAGQLGFLMSSTRRFSVLRLSSNVENHRTAKAQLLTVRWIAVLAG